MEERRATDLYRRTEDHLTSVASAIQRQDRIDLEGLSSLATEIADSVGHSDQLVVQALAGPGGCPLVSDFVHGRIVAPQRGLGVCYFRAQLPGLSLSGLVPDLGLFRRP